MPRALGLVLVCKLAASVISTTIDSLPPAPTVAVLVEAISGAPDTLLTVELPSKHQTSTEEPETRLQRRALQQTSDQPKEKEKRQKKKQQHYMEYTYMYYFGIHSQAPTAAGCLLPVRRYQLIFMHGSCVISVAPISTCILPAHLPILPVFLSSFGARRLCLRQMMKSA